MKTAKQIIRENELIEKDQFLTLNEFEETFGYNPVEELPKLNISEDVLFSINENGSASVNMDNQLFGSFDIDTGEMV